MKYNILRIINYKIIKIFHVFHVGATITSKLEILIIPKIKTHDLYAYNFNNVPTVFESFVLENFEFQIFYFYVKCCEDKNYN